MVLKPCFQCLSISVFKQLPFDLFFPGRCPSNASYEWLGKLLEITGNKKVYILLEEKKQRARYWIAVCSTAVVHQVVNYSLYLSDYYITDKRVNWLITRNHHDIVQFIGKDLELCTIKDYYRA